MKNWNRWQRVLVLKTMKGTGESTLVFCILRVLVFDWIIGRCRVFVLQYLLFTYIVARLRLCAAFHTVDNIQYIGYYRLNSVILRLYIDTNK